MVVLEEHLQRVGEVGLLVPMDFELQEDALKGIQKTLRIDESKIELHVKHANLKTLLQKGLCSVMVNSGLIFLDQHRRRLILMIAHLLSRFSLFIEV